MTEIKYAVGQGVAAMNSKVQLIYSRGCVLILGVVKKDKTGWLWLCKDIIASSEDDR